MKVYNTDQIKNFALLGNSGSGKTTLAESMLFEGKVIDRRGDVENKNTVSDFPISSTKTRYRFSLQCFMLNLTTKS